MQIYIMFNISNTNIYIFYGSMRDGHFESINTQFNMQNAQIILQIHLYFIKGKGAGL